jgi:hypothetical protein
MHDAQTTSEALGGKRSGAGYLACCPAHDDRNPSLRISDGDNGKVIVNCKAGCSQDAVIAALTERGLMLPESTIEHRPNRRAYKAWIVSSEGYFSIRSCHSRQLVSSSQ